LVAFRADGWHPDVATGQCDGDAESLTGTPRTWAQETPKTNIRWPRSKSFTYGDTILIHLSLLRPAWGDRLDFLQWVWCRRINAPGLRDEKAPKSISQQASPGPSTPRHQTLCHAINL